MILDFRNKPKSHKDKLIGDGYSYLVKAAELGKSIEIIESKETKTYPQLKAIYKLFQLCLPHFGKWKPQVFWDLESIKEFAKAELGYTRQPTSFEIAMMIKHSGFVPKSGKERKKMVAFCKKIKKNISFAEFTKEQAFNFAKELEVWAQEKGWSDVYLTNEEKETFWESLEKTKKEGK